MSIEYTDLDPAADEATVRGWLQGYLEQHLTWWSEAYGVGWENDPERIRAHMTEHGLVDREWADITGGASGDEGFVVVARDAAGAPVGLVLATEHTEHFFRVPYGALDWIYVSDAARGQGVGRELMRRTTDWMRSRGFPGAHVYVTAANPAAVKVYERAGFEIVDHRMLVAL